MASEVEHVNQLGHVDTATCVKLAEGKTKQIYELPKTPNFVLIKSKDKITAFNAVRQHELEGKAQLSNVATCKVFQYLQHVDFPSHFVKQLSDTEFIAHKCTMIPIEWVARRVATGSFLKRNEGVKEGYRFSPPKMEMFYKDDALGDPQWSAEMLLESDKLPLIDGVKIGRAEVETMSRATIAIFEVLERAWADLGVSLIDMKVEFGVMASTKEIVLADVIDNDSWRLWPAGDKRLQLDKQFYRDLKEVTEESLKELKQKFATVIEKMEKFVIPPKGRAVVIMGSPTDEAHCTSIKKSCEDLGIPCFLRIASAHKGTQDALRVASEYEGDGIPTVFIAVAGLSNGLGPVLAGNVSSPVINCPPTSTNGRTEDVWSSLHLPSGVPCSTVMSPANAAWHAASILGLQDHIVWSRLRVKQYLNAVSIIVKDKQLTEKLTNSSKAL